MEVFRIRRADHELVGNVALSLADKVCEPALGSGFSYERLTEIVVGGIEECARAVVAGGAIPRPQACARMTCLGKGMANEC